MKSAILFGASGFIGSKLLKKLLDSPNYNQVTIVVRKDLKISHPKLKTILADYHSLGSVSSYLKADDVFITLGTTRAKVKSDKEYYEIDHDYPVRAAQICQQNGATGLFVVTAVGANSNSKAFYIRLKGEVENHLSELNYARTGIFRPSMLMGERDEFRPTEKIIMAIWKVISPLLAGSMTKYKGITGSQVAQAMLSAAQYQKEKSQVYTFLEMINMGKLVESTWCQIKGIGFKHNFE